jgi:hypothetical protein
MKVIHINIAKSMVNDAFQKRNEKEVVVVVVVVVVVE